MSQPYFAFKDDQRVRQLIAAAEHSFASGRADEGERLLNQAEREAPAHPLVMNETARRMLYTGNPGKAVEILKHALQREAAHPGMWLNMAVALRALNQPAEEFDALDRVLALEPRNVRALLQKASLLESGHRPREAAMLYRTALQLIPAGFEPPQAMRPALEHAKQVVRENNRTLEAFLESRLAVLRTRHADQPLQRFDRCLATLVQRRPIYRQQPTFLYFPHLATIEFHERGGFPWLDSIEAAADDIRTELEAVLLEASKGQSRGGSGGLEAYVNHARQAPNDPRWQELTQSKRWGVYFLWREGIAYPEHIARFPKTVAALEAWPRCEIPKCGPTAVFSILAPHTRIPAHTGVNNARLIVHLPLIVPPGCGFRVGAETREWIPGKAFVFDDTVEHEAWNDSDLPRAVLILDVWNPQVSVAERAMLCAMIDGVNDYYGFAQSSGV